MRVIRGGGNTGQTSKSGVAEKMWNRGLPAGKAGDGISAAKGRSQQTAVAMSGSPCKDQGSIGEEARSL